ncbi:MAG: Jag family protein [Clostridium sp.]
MEEKEIYEFKAINKEEALKKAQTELGIDQEAFSYEFENLGQTKTMFSILDTGRILIKVKLKPEKVNKNRFKVEDLEKAKQKIIYFLDDLSNIYKDIEFNYEIKTNGRKLLVTLDNDNMARWIGMQGNTLKALEKVMNSIVQNESKNNIKVQLNIGNYKEVRLEKIKKYVLSMYAKSKREQEDIHLYHMNSYERKIAHDILADKNVDSTSEGEGDNRHIVIRYNSESN